MIDETLFQDFVGNRSEIKKPMTPRAVKMLRNKLNRLESEGQDANKLMERSIINGWQDVYPHESCIKSQMTQNQDFISLHTNKSWREGL
jgi:hypothetical protein